MTKAKENAGGGVDRHMPRTIDWERIAADWATGRFTQVELARKHGIAGETLNRRMKKDRAKNPAAWTRNMEKKVREATAAMLAGQALNQTVAKGQEMAAVLAMAALSRDVILGHRSETKAARRLMAALMAELEGVTTNPGAMARLLAAAEVGLEAADAAALRAQFLNLMQLHQRVGSMQRLADTLAKLHASERKAFGITDEATGDNPMDTMSEVQLEAEISRLEADRLGGQPLRLVG